MITAVVMPQLGLEVSEGSVTSVLVALGDAVERDQPVVELETDKAIAEITAPRAGIVRTIDADPGDVVRVGALLLRLADTADESLENAGDDGVAAAPTNGDAPPDAATAARAPTATQVATPRIRVAPVARRAAAQLGVDLAAVIGTGPRGRITLRDVRARNEQEGARRTDPAPAPASTPAAPPSVPPPAPSELARPPVPDIATATGDVEVTALRRAIARRMTDSQRIPAYELVKDIDATHLLAEKEAQTSRGSARVGINDLLLQALAETVVRHRALATTFHESDREIVMTRSQDADVGLAVATDRGLVVPVIRHADELGLGDIVGERRRLVASARAGRLRIEEMAGGVVTLSSLAGFGIDHFTAMLNPGQSSILAVGRTVEKVVARRRMIAIVPTITLTMTFDHRVVDGATGAAALAELAALLEGAMLWRP